MTDRIPDVTRYYRNTDVVSLDTFRALLERYEALEARVKEIEAELVALSAENERLREALEYYGEQAGAIFSDEEEVNK